jgi:hypothetical protein
MNSWDNSLNVLEYLNKTALTASYEDTGNPSYEWHLYVQAGTSDIIGIENTLPLTCITIEATSTAPGVTTNNWVVLDDIPVYLLNDGPQGEDFPIQVSYRCGQAPGTSIFGAVNDYYLVNLTFTLISD